MRCPCGAAFCFFGFLKPNLHKFVNRANAHRFRIRSARDGPGTEKKFDPCPCVEALARQIFYLQAKLQAHQLFQFLLVFTFFSNYWFLGVGFIVSEPFRVHIFHNVHLRGAIFKYL